MIFKKYDCVCLLCVFLNMDFFFVIKLVFDNMYGKYLNIFIFYIFGMENVWKVIVVIIVLSYDIWKYIVL